MQLLICNVHWNAKLKIEVISTYGYKTLSLSILNLFFPHLKHEHQNVQINTNNLDECVCA